MVAKQCWKVISDAVGTIVGIDLAVIGQFWLSEKRHGILNIVTSAVFGVFGNSGMRFFFRILAGEVWIYSSTGWLGSCKTGRYCVHRRRKT